MFNVPITFFLMAVVAALLGFGGLTDAAAKPAKFLSIVFIMLFVVSLIYDLVRIRQARSAAYLTGNRNMKAAPPE